MPRPDARPQARSHGLSDDGNDSIELLGVDIEAGFGPDNVIGESDLFFNWPLGADPLLDMLRRPSALQETAALGGGRAGHADRGIQFLFRAGLEQERNHD